MTPQHLFRAAAIAAVLMSGSCTTAINGADSIAEDGAVNHPIAVEPSFRDLKVYYAGGADGIPRGVAVRFAAFRADSPPPGKGILAIRGPGGPASRAVITFFAERAAATGISRDKILVSTHEVAN